MAENTTESRGLGRMNGKSVVVTGAAKGIGRATPNYSPAKAHASSSTMWTSPVWKICKSNWRAMG